MSAARSATPSRTVRSLVPARLDRLPWTRYHWLIIIGRLPRLAGPLSEGRPGGDHDAEVGSASKRVALWRWRQRGTGPLSLGVVSGHAVRGLWRRLRQGIGLRFVLPVGAGQPLVVLPQVLFPGGDDKDLHKTQAGDATPLLPL